MKFPPSFILPFTTGLLFIVSFLIIIVGVWISELSKIDKSRIWANIFTTKTLLAIHETFMESLLHRKIFRKNPVLGYMHMSLAFGWFLLIVVGHLEAWQHYQSFGVPVYKAIFMRYFVTQPTITLGGKILAATMDLLLVFVLSGVMLAYYKRFNSKTFGMKKTTQLKTGDRIALTALWFIFPLRFVAECVSAGIHHNGSIISQPTGNFLASVLPVQSMEMPLWWAYSCALGLFFFALPVSRYMHIPVEVVMIFLRNYGIKVQKRIDGYSRIQIYSCSRCGICLDSCQMTHAAIKDTQSVYMLKHLRNRKITDEKLFNCLLCGKCQTDCPVGLELNNLRITQRIESTKEYNSSYEYLKTSKVASNTTTEVIYFAGCMTHLTPSIIKSMRGLFEIANVNYWFMDEEKTACCGRPLMQVGQYAAAQKLIDSNKERIIASGAKKLVVSCPICYKVFREDYAIPGITVQHHSEYLLELMADKRIPVKKTPIKVVYHDPCELGRGSGIYLQPRLLLDEYADVIPVRNEKEKALCCGGSLANTKIQMNERNQISEKAVEEYLSYKPDVLATACPLCKKTFAKSRKLQVNDIAEIVYMAIAEPEKVEEKIESVRKTAIV
ncbi:MAG TPA: (Fe-S)-binding protein [Prolixibacteraceae bacterium]|nr:(Fe-S)-binding protein [Prolixibacteraceae bacterium]HPR86098.1 (Fe-S)-binding protein [Prolixibacteraceae bacterium]